VKPANPDSVNASQKRRMIMTTTTKAALGLAIILATASGGLAATRGHKSTQQSSAPIARQAYPVVDDAVHVAFPQQGGN
jgi:hypothetical protein